MVKENGDNVITEICADLENLFSDNNIDDIDNIKTTYDQPNNEYQITSFRGDYFFLSNFMPSIFEYKGNTSLSVEHFYQAEKSEVSYWCKDGKSYHSKLTDYNLGIGLEQVNNILNNQKLSILNASSARIAKILGRRVTLAPFFEENKLTIMEELLRLKFSNNIFKKLLIDTYPKRIIYENNWGDKFWGTVDGVGLNWHGRLLMKIREELIQ